MAQEQILKKFPLSRAFTFLESGPVILLTTYWRRKRNVMTLSCHASLGFEPTIGLALGPWNHSFEVLQNSGECVVAVPGASLLLTTVDIGNCSGEDVDKFKKFNLSTQKAKIVKAPLLSGCLYNLECRVLKFYEEENFFILRGLAAWHKPGALPEERRLFHARGDGHFFVDGEEHNLRDRMTKWQECI